MDPKIVELAQKVSAFLLPFLPYLLKAGEKAAEEAGKKLGEAAWERAKALWAKLRPGMEAKPAAQEAAQDAAANPQDADAQAALRLQLRKLLEEDPALKAEIARLWGEAQAAGVTVIAASDRSVAIGGSVSGSVIVTGDRNTQIGGSPLDILYFECPVDGERRLVDYYDPQNPPICSHGHRMRPVED